MAFARASAIRGALRVVRPSQASVGRAQQWRQIGRRGYASHGHDAKKASSDLPWLVGAVVVTVPSCWYLLQNGPEAGHGHGAHGDSHGKEHGEDHKAPPKDESESSDEDKSSKKGEDSDSGDESKEADTPDSSDDEGDKDEKDGEKGQKQGKPEEMADGADSESKDTPASSKKDGSQNTQSGKQEGLSNSDTKHPIDVTNTPGTSKKGEGMSESSKAKATVDPKRPQAESNTGKK